MDTLLVTALLDPPAQQARPSPRPRARRTATVLVPALLAALLTVLRYDAQPLWRDEVYTLSTAGRSLADMKGLLSERDGGLVGYYTLMHPWLTVSEASWWIRLPGAVATVVLVALIAVLGRRIAGSAAGLVAGLIAAVTPTVYLHGQEARPYPMALTAVMLTVLMLLRSREAPRWWRWPLIAATALLAVFLHPLVTLPATGAVFAAVFWRPGRASRWAVLAAGIPAALVGRHLVLVGMAQAEERPPAPATLPEFFTFWRLAADVQVLGWLVLALAVAGAVMLLRRRAPAAPVLVLWSLAPVAAVTTLGLTGGYFNQRYASAALPALSVMAAVALVSLRTRLPRRGRLVTVAAVVVLIGALLVAPLKYRFDTAGWDDPPGAAAELAASAQPGDAVVYVGNVVRPMVTAYLPPGVEGSDRLQDVLLLASAADSDTLGGRELRGRDKEGALAPYQRVWLVGSVATATNDLSRISWSAQAVMHGRDLVSSHDHGHLRVELWTTAAPTFAPSPPGTPQ